MLEPALILARYLFLALLLLFLWQLYRVAVRDLRSVAGRSAREDAGGEPRLVALAGTGMTAPGRVYPVRGELTLGRRPDNAIVVDDAYCSGHHARVWLEAGRCWIEDLGSTNGTLLEGRPLAGRAAVEEQAEIGIGSTRLRYER